MPLNPAIPSDPDDTSAPRHAIEPDCSARDAARGPLPDAVLRGAATPVGSGAAGSGAGDPELSAGGDMGPTPWPERACDQVLLLAVRYRWLIVGLVGVLYVLAFTGRWRIEPDSGLYLSLARNLAEGQGYTYLGQPHRLAYPGLPVMFAGVFRVFGSESLVPVHLLMLAITAATLTMTYRLFKLHTGPAVAIVVTAGVACSDLFFRYGFHLMTDMPFLLGVMATLAGWERVMIRSGDRADQKDPGVGDWVLLLGGLALAVVMRPTMVALVGAVVAASLVAVARGRVPRRRAAIPLVGIVAVGLMFLLVLDPRRSSVGVDDYELALVNQLAADPGSVAWHVWGNAVKLLGAMTPEAAFGIEMWPPFLNAVVGVTLLAVPMMMARRRAVWGLWMAGLVGMMLVVLPERRYLLAALPLITYGWWLICVKVNRSLPKHAGNLLFAGLLLLGTGPNVGKCIQFILEQRDVALIRFPRDDRNKALPTMAEQIVALTEADAVVVSELKSGRVLSYLTRRRVVEARDMAALQIDPGAQPLYLLEPADAEMRAWKRSAGVAAGEKLAEVDRGKLGTLSLHKAVVGGR